MLQPLYAKAPLIVIATVISVLILAVGAKLGFAWETLALLVLIILSVGLALLLWSLNGYMQRREKHTRQLRFIAERFQSMLHALPGGYCLFSPQGLLREEVAVAARLGLAKIAHFDDIVGAVKESVELVASFRRLQQDGAGFEMQLHGAAEPFNLQLIGRRFQIGHDGPLIDMLWFAENAVLAAELEGKIEQLSKFEDQSQDIQNLIDALSFPVWVRSGDLRIVMCNEAYAKALDTTVASVIADQKELMSQTARGGSGRTLSANALTRGQRQTERRHVITGGQRRLMEIIETPLKELQEKKQVVQGPQSGFAEKLIGKIAPEALPKKKEAEPASETAAPNLTDRFAQAAAAQENAETPAKDAPLAVKTVPAETALAAVAQKLDETTSNVSRLIGYALDVTAEEEKDTELKRHMAAHHEVMEHLGAAIAIYGPDTKLEFYNRAYQRLWEAEESFLDGKPTMGEVLEDLRTRRRLPEQADFQRYKKERLALFTSLLEPQEDLMYLPDGTTLRILAAPHPFGGIMFVHEDVTDRLALESSYNTLIAVQRETLDNLAEGIAVFGSDGKLRLSNPAFARIWKLPHDFLAAEPHVADLLEKMKPLFNYGSNWASFKAEMVSYTLDRNARTGRIERADEAVIEFLTVPLPDGAVLNSYLDVTDSVRVEQALRASNAALATADRLKSDFVANVSYQLRTPLNTITGFAEILSEQYFGTLNPRQMEYTQTIQSEAEKLTRLINDVLDLATIEAGRMELERHPTSVAKVLNDAKLMTAEWARQQQISIVIDCPSDIGTFDVDEQRIKQALFNLISNAIKFTPAEGRVVLGAEKRDEWIVISVMDTGIGIPEADRERVFGKFERANPQVRQAGAGLGLSLVKSFVELHGGRIELQSDTDRGTMVQCFLPIKVPSAEPAEEMAAAPQD